MLDMLYIKKERETKREREREEKEIRREDR